MNEQQLKQSILGRLKHSLQALALPAHSQVAYLPNFVVKTDELVLDFDHWRGCAIGSYRADLTAAQLDTLAAVDTHIATPNFTDDRSVWDESALYSHAFWEELRSLAIQSLNAFGWPQETPPSHAHEYVSSKQR